MTRPAKEGPPERTRSDPTRRNNRDKPSRDERSGERLLAIVGEFPMRHDQIIEPAVLIADRIEREPRAGSSLVTVRFHKPRTHDARRPSNVATARFHARAYSGYSRYSHAGPRRRRLRREIRWMGLGLLSILPLFTAVLLLRGAAVQAVSMENSDVAPYATSISIDASGSLSAPGASIVFPGYLLPDDGSSEDSAHAGG